MKLARSLAVAVVVLGAGVPAAYGQGIPVIDATNVVQTTIAAQQAIEQVRQLQEAYQTQLQELDQAVAQVQAMTGNRSLGELVNGNVEHDLRRYLPDTWLDTLRVLEATGVPASAADVERIFRDLSESYDVATAEDYAPGDPDAPAAQAHQRTTETGYATLATSETAFNQTGRRVSAYETFLAELDRTSDVKASIDLMARIAAENGLTANEILRLQAINLQLSGTVTTQQQVNASADARMNRFQPTRLGEIPTTVLGSPGLIAAK